MKNYKITEQTISTKNSNNQIFPKQNPINNFINIISYKNLN